MDLVPGTVKFKSKVSPSLLGEGRPPKRRPVSSSLPLLMSPQDDDYSSVPDAMDLIHLDGDSADALRHPQQHQSNTYHSSFPVGALEPSFPRPASSEDRLVYLERRALANNMSPQGKSEHDFFHAGKGEETFGVHGGEDPLAWTQQGSSSLASQHIDLSAVVKSTIVEAPKRPPPPPPRPFTPVQQEKSILAPISKTFTQHWIDIGTDLNVLLLDFDAAFTLLIPNVERGKPFKTNTTTVEVQTRLTSKGQKLTFMKFHFVNPESKIVAPVLDDKALGYKLLKKRSACVFLGRTLDDIKSAPPRRISPMRPSELMPSMSMSAHRPQMMVLPCPPPTLPLPPVDIQDAVHNHSDVMNMLPSLPLNPSGRDEPSWSTSSVSTAQATQASPLSSQSDLNKLQSLPPTPSVQNNPVPPSERVYPKNLVSIYPALKEKELEKIVQCRYCSKRFSFLSEHLIHLKSHTHDVDKVVEMSIQVWVSDRKLKCDKCKKKKTYTLDYAKHKDSHEIFGLSCHICEASIPLPANFGPHMEEFHPLEILGDKSESHNSPNNTEMIPLVPNLSPSVSSPHLESSVQRGNNSHFAPVAIKSTGSPFTQGFVAKKSVPPSFISMSKSPPFSEPNSESINSHDLPPLSSSSASSSTATSASLQNLMCSSTNVSSESQVPLLQKSHSPFNESNHLGGPTEASPGSCLQMTPNPVGTSPMLRTQQAFHSPVDPLSSTSRKSPSSFSSSDSPNLGLFSPGKESSLSCLQSSEPATNSLNVSSVERPSCIENGSSTETCQKLDSLESQPPQQWRNEDSRVIQSLFDDTDPMTKSIDSDKIGLSLSSVDSGVSDVNSASPSIPNFDRSVPLMGDGKSIRDSLDSKPDEEFLSALDMYGLESQSRKMHSQMSINSSGSDMVNRHNILTDEPMLEELPSKVMQLEELCNTIDMSMEDVPSRDTKSWKTDSGYGNYDDKIVPQTEEGLQGLESNSKLFDPSLNNDIQNSEDMKNTKQEWNDFYSGPKSAECAQEPILNSPTTYANEENNVLSGDNDQESYTSELSKHYQDFEMKSPRHSVISAPVTSPFGVENDIAPIHPSTTPSDGHAYSSCKSSGESEEELGLESSCAIYKCEKCGDEFVTSTSLNIHKISCVTDYKCSLCDNRFMSLKSLKMHTSMCKKKSEAIEKDQPKMTKPCNIKAKNSSSTPELRNESCSDENKNILKVKPVVGIHSNRPKTRVKHTKSAETSDKPRNVNTKSKRGPPQEDQNVYSYNSDSKQKDIKSQMNARKEEDMFANPNEPFDAPESKPSLKINVGQILRQKELQNRLKERSSSKRKKKHSHESMKYPSISSSTKPPLTRKLSIKKPLELNKEMEYQKPVVSIKVKPPKLPSLKVKFGLSNVNKEQLPENSHPSASAKNRHRPVPESVERSESSESCQMVDKKHFGSCIRTDSDGHIRLRLTLSSKSKGNKIIQKEVPEPEVKKVKPGPKVKKVKPEPKVKKVKPEPEAKKVKPLKLKLNKTQPDTLPSAHPEPSSPPPPVLPLKIKLPLRKDQPPVEVKGDCPSLITSFKVPKLVIKKDLIKRQSPPRQTVFIKNSILSLKRLSKKKPRVLNSLFQSLDSISCFVKMENIVAYRCEEDECKKSDGFIVKLNEKDCSSLDIRSPHRDSPPSQVVPPLRLKLNKKLNSSSQACRKPDSGRSLSSLLSSVTGSQLQAPVTRVPLMKKKKASVISVKPISPDAKCLSSTLDMLLSSTTFNIPSADKMPQEKKVRLEAPPPQKAIIKKDRPYVAPKKSSSYLGLTRADYRRRKRRKKLPLAENTSVNKIVLDSKDESLEAHINKEAKIDLKVPSLKIKKKLICGQNTSVVVPPIKVKTNVFFAKKSLPKPVEDVESQMDFYSYQEKQLVEEDTKIIKSDHSEVPPIPVYFESSVDPSPIDSVDCPPGCEMVPKCNSVLLSDGSTDSLASNVELVGITAIVPPKVVPPEENLVPSSDCNLENKSLDKNRSTEEVHQKVFTSYNDSNNALKKNNFDEAIKFKHLDGVIQDEFLRKLNLWKSNNSKSVRTSSLENGLKEPKRVSPFSSGGALPSGDIIRCPESHSTSSILNIVTSILSELLNTSIRVTQEKAKPRPYLPLERSLRRHKLGRRSTFMNVKLLSKVIVKSTKLFQVPIGFKDPTSNISIDFQKRGNTMKQIITNAGRSLVHDAHSDKLRLFPNLHILRKEVVPPSPTRVPKAIIKPIVDKNVLKPIVKPLVDNNAYKPMIKPFVDNNALSLTSSSSHLALKLISRASKRKLAVEISKPLLPRLELDNYSCLMKKPRLIHPSTVKRRAASPIDFPTSSKQICIRSELGFKTRHSFSSINKLQATTTNVISSLNFSGLQYKSLRNSNSLGVVIPKKNCQGFFRRGSSKSIITQLSVDSSILTNGWMLPNGGKSKSWEQFTFDFSQFISSDNKYTTEASTGTSLIPTGHSWIGCLVRFLSRQSSIIAQRLRKLALGSVRKKRPYALTFESNSVKRQKKEEDPLPTIVFRIGKDIRRRRPLKRLLPKLHFTPSHYLKNVMFDPVFSVPRITYEVKSENKFHQFVSPILTELLDVAMALSDTPNSNKTTPSSDSPLIVQDILEELIHEATRSRSLSLEEPLENFDDCIPLLSVRVPPPIERMHSLKEENDPKVESLDVIDSLIEGICEDVVRSSKEPLDGFSIKDSIVEPIIQNLLHTLLL